MGAAGTAVSGDGWAILRNPALAAEGVSSVGLSWSQEFGLPELSRETISVKFPLRLQRIGVRVSNFGSQLYRETECGVIFARSVRSGLSAGVEIGGRQLSIDSYPSATAVTCALGLCVRPISGLNVAAVWRNLNRPKLPNYRDRIPEMLVVGVSAQIAKQGLLAADLIQERHFPLEVRIGAEAIVSKGFTLRVGMRAEPVRPSLGFQVDVGRWSFLYAGDLHPDLGPSHSAGLEIRLGK